MAGFDFPVLPQLPGRIHQAVSAIPGSSEVGVCDPSACASAFGGAAIIKIAGKHGAEQTVKFPDEIATQILNFLPVQDLACFSETSRAGQTLVKDLMALDTSRFQKWLEKGPHYGLELTFSHPVILSLNGKVGSENNTKQLHLMEQVQRVWLRRINALLTTGCIGYVCSTKVQFVDRYPFLGWWYNVSVDGSVIELQTKPMSKHAATILGPIIQHYIFDFAAKLQFVIDLGQGPQKFSLVPDRNEGAGHIHIGLATGFRSDPRILLNFITEINNLGVWPFLDVHLMETTAPPLSALHNQSRNYYGRIVREFDKKNPTLEELIELIETKVYKAIWSTGIPPEHDRGKYETVSLQKFRNCLGDVTHLTFIQQKLRRRLSCHQVRIALENLNEFMAENNIKEEHQKKLGKALKSLARAHNMATVEIRAFRPQTSAAELLIELRLLSRLIRFSRQPGIREYRDIGMPRVQGHYDLNPITEIVASRIVDLFRRLNLEITDYLHIFPTRVKVAVLRAMGRAMPS